MKKSTLIFYFIAIVCISSCAYDNDNGTHFKTTELFNLFEIEIPSGFEEYCSSSGMITWIGHNKRSFLTVETLNEKTSYFANTRDRKKELTNDGWKCSLIEESDTTYSYKFAKGMTMGVSSCRIKKLDNYIFRITYESLNGNVIHNMSIIVPSLQYRIKPLKLSASTGRGVFENEYYSIELPKDWKYLLHPDVYSDVYLSAPSGDIAAVICHFDDVEMPLDEIVSQIYEQPKEIGWKVKCYNKKLNGIPAIVGVADMNLLGKQRREYQYCFLYDDKFYSIKFMGVLSFMKRNKQLCDSIVSSFKIKKLPYCE